uniref:SCP domain-containing protein n=1 Tax=Steinernema glaseri TaxID=37863 RepID=A0A1I8AN33_9BILA
MRGAVEQRALRRKSRESKTVRLLFLAIYIRIIPRTTRPTVVATNDAVFVPTRRKCSFCALVDNKLDLLTDTTRRAHALGTPPHQLESSTKRRLQQAAWEQNYGNPLSAPGSTAPHTSCADWSQRLGLSPGTTGVHIAIHNPRIERHGWSWTDHPDERKT